MPRRPVEGLTNRQHQILAYLADGLTQRQIARALWLKEETIRDHSRELRRTLRAQTCAHAVSIAYLAGLLPIEAGRR